MKTPDWKKSANDRVNKLLAELKANSNERPEKPKLVIIKGGK